MLSEEKKLALEAFLGALPGPMALRLARIVEIDQLSDGPLPHEEILDFLRPALRQYGERKRVATPLRYFCLPFEDFLFNGPRRQKRKGCISRSVIVPLWNWVGHALIREETADYVAQFKDAVLDEDSARCDILAARYWKASAEAIAKAIIETPDEIKAHFETEFLFADVCEVPLLLAGGPLLQQLKALFPKPAPEPNEELMTIFRELFFRVRSVMPDLVAYLPVAAMGRLEKPWHAVRLATTVTHQQKETLVAATDIGLVGEILFDRMEDAKTVIIAQHRLPEFHSGVLLDALSEFTLLSSAITKEVDILRTGIWGKRLLSNRTVVSSVMDSYMERAAKEIAAAIPLKSTMSGAETLVPNFVKDVGERAIGRALRYAELLAGCRYLAAPAAFVVKYDTAKRDVVETLRFYDEAMLSELRAKQWPDRERVEQRFQIAVELTRILMGTEAATMLQRRGELAKLA